MDCDFEYSAEFYKKILEFSHDEIFVTNGDGVTLYCNKTFEKHYGMKRSEMLGKNVQHLLSNGYCTDSPLPLVIKNKREITMDQETSTGKKLVITANPVLDKNGDIEIIIENCRDITELESIKYTLEKTKKQMEIYKNQVDSLREKEIRINHEVTFKSEKMKPILEIIKRISQIDTSILLLGESGTGKSLLANYIHNNSSRRNGPFITINCTTIPPQLFESEIFGYVNGAFTGAKKNGKIGLAELADGGTLFLDEVGDIPIATQGKFLELIQEHRFSPIGAVNSKNIDVRIISATNHNLVNLVNERKFREDLFYRLNVIDIKIPPLRDRPEDVVELINFFLKKYNYQYNLSVEFTEAAMSALLNYTWKGNIRELQNSIEQIVVTAPRNIISQNDLPHHICKNSKYKTNNFCDNVKSLNEALNSLEKELIISAYNKYKSSYKVASALNISQSTANRLIRKYVTI